MKVSDNVRALYHEDSADKQISIILPNKNITLDNSCIYEESSFHLKEALMDNDNVEFVGCISSYISVDIKNAPEDIKGEYIEVYQSVEGLEKIPLFHGYVDSAQKQADKTVKRIIAYDALYKKGNKNIARWYNALTFPISLGDIRHSLFRHLGIEQEQTQLPNDDIVINKEYTLKSLKAIDTIKSVCQINGVFGIINREEKFEYRIPLVNTENGAYPGPLFFPGANAYPGFDKEREKEAEHIAYYQKVDYEEYTVKPVDKVTIRQSDQEEGVSYGTGENNYIIQGNMFTRNLTERTLLKIAQNIYNNVQGIEFCPFTSNNNGLPYLEVGKDKVSFCVLDEDGENFREKSFYVFSRELKGIQNLMDTYQAAGDEYQREFVTDLHLQIETIKQNITTEVEREVKKITYDKDEIDRLEERIRILEENQQKWVSVDSLPEHPDPGTWYVIRGEAVVG